MAKEDKVNKLSFNLDDAVEVDKLNTVDTEELPVLEEENKFDALMLPVPVATSEGNYTYHMKLLDNVTADEFKSWLRSVLPLPEESLDNFMALNAKNKNHSFSNLKVRREIFNAVIKMHEMRWVFGRGTEKLSNEVRWN